MAAHMYSTSLAVACCCLIFGVFAEWNTNDYLRREHTLVKPYQGSGSSMSLWDFVGSTLVTNNYVRLTPDHQSRQGAIWNTQACNTRNWELHVQFAVHGSGTTLFGDGLAIWYAKEKNRLGGVFGNADFFSGLAIFLDTYSNHNGPHNHEHPYISAMVNNGSMSYDHDRDGTHTQLAGCEAKFRNKDHSTYLAIRYHDNILKVSMDIDNKNGWKECFEVRGIKLPLGYYFGASAATGQLADNHDIISMKLYELDAPEGQLDYWGLPSAEVFDAPRDRVEDVRSSMSGWKIFLIIILAIIGLGVCGVVGYLIFNKNNDYTRKRFY
ncbi:vesicular integral-membrane protein VIP36-like [Argopecten irradians]|uniref:vesicular integral-membrane protein VIP36-like n=1 Tax=Argopecten irradians TaxID=31199 RepID=UPI003723B5B2